MRYIEPEFIFETSWEVCNKVGGIYAVLSTRARSMSELYGDNVLFVGPMLSQDTLPVDFKEEAWDKKFVKFVMSRFGLKVRIGRWQVPGTPKVALVDFAPLYERKNDFYGEYWNEFGVDSLHAYGDYDESSMFGCAAGMVMHAYYEHFKLGDNVIAHFNEWMTGFGLFYMRRNVPAVATLFTTHATTVGRSIAGNGKPLYDYMPGYFGDQMAAELNVESKHSVEKKAAHFADCFTTVSDITDVECRQLLEKPADVVTPNGFEFDFVPAAGKALTSLHDKSRKQLIEVAEKVLGYSLPADCVLCATSGRYEYKNKGIDVFVGAMNRLRSIDLNRTVVAFALVPAWQMGACTEWNDDNRFTTHVLGDFAGDPLLRQLRECGFSNSEADRVKVIFVPAYLVGDDGIFNRPYFDVLAGFDFTLFPSYYEPWGYTPMESVAFSVPTITSDKAGFGLWANGGEGHIESGVAVVHRTDSNYHEACAAVADECRSFIVLSDDQAKVKAIGAAARKIARSAQWKNFFKHYQRAYHVALANLAKRK